MPQNQISTADSGSDAYATSKFSYTLRREIAAGGQSAPSAKSVLNLRATLTQAVDAPWIGTIEASQTVYSGAGQSSRVFKRENLAGEPSAQNALNRLNRFVEKLGPKKAAWPPTHQWPGQRRKKGTAK